MPADPAFRPLAAEAAAKYGATLGLPLDEAGALAVSVQEAADRAAGAAAGTVQIVVVRAGATLELTVTGGTQSSTLSRSLAGARS